MSTSRPTATVRSGAGGGGGGGGGSGGAGGRVALVANYVDLHLEGGD